MADRPGRTVPGVPGHTNRFARVRTSTHYRQPRVSSGIGRGAGETGHPRTGTRAGTARTTDRRYPEGPGFLATAGNIIAGRSESSATAALVTCRPAPPLVVLGPGYIIRALADNQFAAVPATS